MATIYSPNIAPVTGDLFAHAWQGIRAQLKAGWLLKHSSDGSAKSSANSADPMNCKWGVPAIVQDYSATGIGHITTQSGKDFLFTELSGLVVPTNTNRGGSEGNLLVVTNATNAGNNVTWLITNVVSTTSCYARPLVPTATTAFGTAPPTCTINGHLARTNRWNLKVQADTTGALGTCKVKISLDGGTNYATAVTVPTAANGATVEVIDNNGIATGVYLTFSGAINNLDNYWTSTSAVVNDDGVGGTSGVGNGLIRWVERSWITTAYPAITSGGWLGMEGPCTIKVPFTTAPTNNPSNGSPFLRGENAVQTGSGAEGEVMGVSYEPTTGVGYMLISPRLQGNSTGVEGWGAGVITGSVSGATVTPSAAPTKRLVREAVWVRGTSTTNGTIVYQPVLDATENANRYGYLAVAASGCTATVFPGGGGTNNGAPTIANVVAGTLGSVSHQGSPWTNTNYTALTGWTVGNLQHFAANCIERQNVSADGSHIGIIGQPTQSTQSAGMICPFMRFDGAEEGDFEPYGWWAFNWNVTTPSRTTNTSGYTNAPYDSIIGISTGYAGAGDTLGAGGPFFTWQKRDLTGDTFAGAHPLIPGGYMRYGWNVFQFTNIYATNVSDPERIANSAQTIKPLALLPVDLFCYASAIRGRKGSLRWVFAFHGNNAFDTFGGKTWMQAFPFTANQVYGIPFVVPYDGSTTPVQ